MTGCREKASAGLSSILQKRIHDPLINERILFNYLFDTSTASSHSSGIT